MGGEAFKTAMAPAKRLAFAGSLPNVSKSD
jgi:hypothetical protein